MKINPIKSKEIIDSDLTFELSIGNMARAISSKASFASARRSMKMTLLQDAFLAHFEYCSMWLSAAVAHTIA